jgi:single-strand DNA-binding protein
MSGETQITVIGNLTADPELRYTQNGLAVANFTVASTPRIFDRQKEEWRDGETLFLRATVWRDYAEHVAQLHKGDNVVVVGSLGQKGYETKDGEKRTSYELAADEVGALLRYATVVIDRTSAKRAEDVWSDDPAAPANAPKA